MDYDLRLLPSFVALADELHFGRAAERLHVGQPALSQQLTRLEHQLGVRLVERDSRHVALTPAGHAFLGGARSALALAEDAAAAARDARAARAAFRLGIDIDVPGPLVRRIRRFGARDGEHDLRVTIAQQGDLLDALARGRLDAVAVWGGGTPAAGLGAARLTGVAIHAVVARDDPLAARDRIAREQLAGHRLAIYLPTDATRPFYDHLLGALAVGGQVPRTVHVEAGDDEQEAMLDRVERDGGYTICVGGQLERPALVARPLDPPLEADVLALWHGSTPPAPVLALQAWLRRAEER